MNWVVGQRVYQEEDPKLLGTVTEISATEIKVVWDDGGVSFHEIKSNILLRLAR